MKRNDRTKNSVLNLITGFGGQIITTILSFFVRTVFINVLGKEFLGINGLFSNILSMLSLTELGLDTAINFKLYKPLAQHDEHRIRLLMKFYRDAYRIVGIVILFLGICLIPALPVLIKDYKTLEPLGINASLVFVLYLLQSVSSYLFFASRSAIVKADQKQYLLDIVGLFVNIIRCIVEILILIRTHNFILYTMSIIGFMILQNLLNAIVAKKIYPYAFAREKESISKEELLDIFKDLGAVFINKINNVVIKSTDNIVLSTFIGLSVVGMYSNYLLFYATIRTILSKVYNATKASAGNLFALEDTKTKYFFFENMNYISIILFGTASIGIAVMADEVVITWIGADYVIPQPFSILMSIEILFVGLKLNLGQIRNVAGAFRQMWFRPIIGIIINIVVSIVLVKKLGICGVLIGTISADILANFMVDPSIIYKYVFNNYRPVSNYYVKCIKYFSLLIIVGVIDGFLCRNIIVGHGWISVIVHFIICGISVPIAFMVFFKNRHETKYVFEKCKSILKR